MSISEADVRHVAALARLEIADGRVDALVRELNGILVHMDVLQQVELQGADARHEDEEMSSRTAVTPMREDDPTSDPLARSRAEFAPAERDGFFLVPRLATHE